MSEANGKDPEEKQREEKHVKSVLALLDTLTKDEIDRLKNNEPVIKDFAGDAVLINFTTRFEDIPEGANLADHMEIKAMPLVDFNNSWRKKMAKQGR